MFCILKRTSLQTSNSAVLTRPREMKGCQFFPPPVSLFVFCLMGSWLSTPTVADHHGELTVCSSCKFGFLSRPTFQLLINCLHCPVTERNKRLLFLFFFFNLTWLEFKSWSQRHICCSLMLVFILAWGVFLRVFHLFSQHESRNSIVNHVRSITSSWELLATALYVLPDSCVGKEHNLK